MKHDDSQQDYPQHEDCHCGHDHCHCEDENDGEGDCQPDYEVDMAFMRQMMNTKDEMYQEIEQLRKRLNERYDERILTELLEKIKEHVFILGMFEETQEQQAELQNAVDLIRQCKPEELSIALRRQLVDLLCEMGSICLEQQDYDLAQKYFEDSLKEAESLAAEGDEMGRIDFGGILLNECAVFTERGEYEKAESVVLQAIDRLNVSAKQEYSNKKFAHLAWATLADALMIRSQQLLDHENKERDLIVSTVKEAIDIFRKLRDEDDTDFLDKLGSALLYLYDIDGEDRPRQESIDLLNEAINAMEKVADREECDVEEDLENARDELDDLLNEDDEEEL